MITLHPIIFIVINLNLLFQLNQLNLNTNFNIKQRFNITVSSNMVNFKSITGNITPTIEN